MVLNTAGLGATKRPMSILPREILQRVFFFTVSSDNINRDHKALHDLCSVDREWRRTAINHCALWTQLPTVDLGDTKTSPTTLRHTVSTTTLFLARSGALPISFNLIVERSALSSSNLDSDVLEAIHLLVDQCHRWNVVELKSSEFGYKHLLPIKGRLPMLTSLKLHMPLFFVKPEDLPRNVFDMFGDAPQLRHLDASLHWRPLDGVISPVFPWSQLEDFKYSAPEEEVYHTLLEAQPITLRTLEYCVRDFRFLPLSIPLTLPHLEKLVLRIKSEVECDLLAHLSTLTLPLLAHLELWGRLRIASHDVYETFLALVARSGCSLQTLFLCLSSSDLAVASVDAFKQLMALSPNLETLHMTTPRSDILRVLTLDTSAPEPLLPKLRVLALHYHGAMNWDPIFLDGAVLGAVIESRTLALKARQDAQYRMLDETIFSFYADVGLHIPLFMNSFVKDLDDKVDFRSKLAISKAMIRLYWNFTDSGAWLWRRKQFNPLFLGKMDLMMRRLESLEVKKSNTEAIMVRRFFSDR